MQKKLHRRLQNDWQKISPEEKNSMKKPMRHERAGYITNAPKIICLGSNIYFPVDIQIRIMCGLGKWMVKSARLVCRETWLLKNQEKYFPTKKLALAFTTDSKNYLHQANCQSRLTPLSHILKRLLFSGTCQPDFMQLLEGFQTLDHMPDRLDKRKMVS